MIKSVSNQFHPTIPVPRRTFRDSSVTCRPTIPVSEMPRSSFSGSSNSIVLPRVSREKECSG